MIKRILSILIILIPFFSNAQIAVGDWNVYSIYSTLNKIEQSNEKVYFLSSNYLYSFDKNTQEVYYYTLQNKLNDNNISNIYYNKEGKYLFIVYKSGNIDLLYDDGTVENMPDIKDASLNYATDINDVAFKGDYIYVATKYGLVIFNEKKHEVKSSGIYGKEISKVACVDDYIVVDQNHSLYFIQKDERIEVFDNFTLLTSGYYIDDLEGLKNNRLLFRSTSKNISIFEINFDKKNFKSISIDSTGKNGNLIYGKEAYYYINADVVYSISFDGEKNTHLSLPSELTSQVVSIWDNPAEVWVGDSDGMANYNVANNTVLYDKFRPQAISVNYPFYITSDKNGKIYISNRSESAYFGFSYNNRSFISTIENYEIQDITLKEFPITHKSNPSKKSEYLYDTFQLAIDPEDIDTYYIGTFWEGLYKVKNGKVISQYNPENSSLLESWGCRVNAVAFDKYNNLWCTNEVVNTSQPALHILPAAKRKKETTTIEDWIPINLGDFTSVKDVKILICEKSNMIFIIDGKWSGYVVAYDTKGTYDNISDDKYLLWDSFTDQDGKSFDPDRISAIVEDKNGRVWIGTSNGVIEISNPKNATNPSMTINRIKVPRNDGTNYADYLLDAIHVTSISVDNSNRKWLGTMTDGVYLVSENGNEIIEHFTPENSYHPGGKTYCVYAHPLNNSIFIGTENGLVEYSSTSAPTKEDLSEIYAYPNPVKPEYKGLIIIKGLMDNTLVKIADSAGNVFYTTRSEGGMVTWDGCNASGERVKSGVYFVFASQNADEQSEGAVTKILIIN